MHLYDIEKGFFGGWGIVGGHTALGMGLAFAAKYRSEDRVTIDRCSGGFSHGLGLGFWSV